MPFTLNSGRSDWRSACRRAAASPCSHHLPVCHSRHKLRTWHRGLLPDSGPRHLFMTMFAVPTSSHWAPVPRHLLGSEDPDTLKSSLAALRGRVLAEVSRSPDFFNIGRTGKEMNSELLFKSYFYFLSSEWKNVWGLLILWEIQSWKCPLGSCLLMYMGLSDRKICHWFSRAQCWNGHSRCERTTPSSAWTPGSRLLTTDCVFSIPRGSCKRPDQLCWALHYAFRTHRMWHRDPQDRHSLCELCNKHIPSTLTCVCKTLRESFPFGKVAGNPSALI